MKEDSRPFFLLPYVAMKVSLDLRWTVTPIWLGCSVVKGDLSPMLGIAVLRSRTPNERESYSVRVNT